MNGSRDATEREVSRTLDALSAFPLDPDTHVIVGQHSTDGGSVSLFPRTLDIAVELVGWLEGPTVDRNSKGRGVRGIYEGATFCVWAPTGHTARDILDALPAPAVTS